MFNFKFYILNLSHYLIYLNIKWTKKKKSKIKRISTNKVKRKRKIALDPGLVTEDPGVEADLESKKFRLK
jgi:hypothetical protein